MTEGRILHADGRSEERPVEWSVESIKAIVGGDFDIVGNYYESHVIEARDWHFKKLAYNQRASELCGRMLHGTILIIKEPSR